MWCVRKSEKEESSSLHSYDLAVYSDFKQWILVIIK